MADQAAPLPPQNLDAEENVLGAMMLAASAIDAVSGLVSARDFYRHHHATIFTAILALHDAGEPADAITVAARLEQDGTLEEVGGKDRIRDIALLVPAVGNVARYARIVREVAVRRGLTVVGEQITRLGWEGPGESEVLVEAAEGMIFDLAASRASDFVTAQVAVGEAVDRLTTLHESGRELSGLPTGFRDLDALTSGLQPGNLVVIAARPSMGKSALACGIVGHVCLRLGLPVAFHNLEMTRGEVVNRILSMEALVDSRRFLNGSLEPDEWQRVMSLSSRVAAAPLFIDDNRLVSATEIRSKCRRLKLRHPDLALVVVDYLQLMSREVRDRVNEVAQISRSLKILAGELNVPVIALSQLSRALETRHDRRPILSDLRDSGAIEQDADLVLFIYRDEIYNPEDPEVQGVAELNLAKQRNGPVDTVRVTFVKRYARFSEMPRPGAGDVR